MMKKSYQRRHLRAPYREHVLYTDGDYVLRAEGLNISEGGMFLDGLPSIPNQDELSLLISLPQYPYFKNFSLLKMQTFSSEIFQRHVVRAKARMVRRENLAQSLDSIFRSRIGLEFIEIAPLEQKNIDEYVATFTSNLIYLQTLIDSFNTDDETKNKVRTLASILEFDRVDKISELREEVTHLYKSLQWL